MFRCYTLAPKIFKSKDRDNELCKKTHVFFLLIKTFPPPFEGAFNPSNDHAILQPFDPSKDCMILRRVVGSHSCSFNPLKDFAVIQRVEWSPVILQLVDGLGILQPFELLCHAWKDWRITCDPSTRRRITWSLEGWKDHVQSFKPSKDYECNPSKGWRIAWSLDGLKDYGWSFNPSKNCIILRRVEGSCVIRQPYQWLQTKSF